MKMKCIYCEAAVEIAYSSPPICEDCLDDIDDEAEVEDEG